MMRKVVCYEKGCYLGLHHWGLQFMYLFFFFFFYDHREFDLPVAWHKFKHDVRSELTLSFAS